MMTNRIFGATVLAGLISLTTGCSGVLDVESPGRIADDDLNNEDAISGLVVGMSCDLTQAYDGVLQDLALASGELWHGGSYDFGALPRGIILPEDINGEWASMQQARWVAENGIERMKTTLAPDVFARSALVARAYLLAGMSNRFLGENVCETVIDGGPAQPHTIHFSRAIDHFTKAIEIGQAAGASTIVTAAYAGRASVKAWSGDWAGGVQDAMKVPTGFEYDAIFSSENDNDIAYETHTRYEFTIYSTEFADHASDARAPWKILYTADGKVARGANGATPMYQQDKYIDGGDDVPLVKGTEMLVLRAEAALRNNDIAGAIDLMNQARAAYGLSALAMPSGMAEAWKILHYERGATTWLEGRRLWDLRRWYAETGPAQERLGPGDCGGNRTAERSARP